MKAPFFSLLLFVSLLSASSALDIVTPTGTFKDVKMKGVEGEGVRISHSEGNALLDFDELPADMQLQYGWTPEKSAARKATRDAEAKRIADEERMIEEAPKRKAMEAAAKKKAEEDRIAAEETERRRIADAAFEKENASGPRDLVAEAADARAEIERERERARKKARGEPIDEPVAALPVATIEDPNAPKYPSKNNVVLPPFGTVSSLFEQETIWTKYRNVWIGVGIAAVVVFVLFLLPSGNKPKVRRR